MSESMSTRERRHQPMLIVNTGDGKGKTTAACGLALRAWAQGWDVGVYQFIKSGTWRVGEEKALRALSGLPFPGGQGGQVTWEHQGTGWTWTRPNTGPTHTLGPNQEPGRAPGAESWDVDGATVGAARSPSDELNDAAGRRVDLPDRSPSTKLSAVDSARAGWLHVKQLLAQQRHDFYLLDEFTYVMANGWVDTAEVVDVLTHRPGHQHVVITGRRCPEEILAIADLATQMTKLKHPFDAGQRGQAGIEW